MSVVTSLTAASVEVAAEICRVWGMGSPFNPVLRWEREVDSRLGIRLVIDSFDGAMIERAGQFALGFHAGWCYRMSKEVR
jgi:hypothetical protein